MFQTYKWVNEEALQLLYWHQMEGDSRVTWPYIKVKEAVHQRCSQILMALYKE